MTTVAERIAHLRATIDLGQEAAARRAHIETQLWAAIESGDHTPTLGEVVGIAAALGTTTTAVIGKQDDDIRWNSVDEHLSFLAEAEAHLHASGYLGDE